MTNLIKDLEKYKSKKPEMQFTASHFEIEIKINGWIQVD